MRFLLFAAAGALLAQNSTPPVKSPEVHADGRVTFRIRAPNAASVALVTDWMGRGESKPLAKGDGGVWSLTLGPLEPSTYIYGYVVDGVTMADPVNPRVKLRAFGSGSFVEVPDKGAIWQERDVPHGKVEINWGKSAVLGGETRWVWIYTPPGYAASGKRYPVLYLLHGSNDTAAGWTMAGQANFIFDNLLAEKKMAPMVVVMPFGHAVPFGQREAFGKDNNALFEDYLLRDVVPMVRSEYRVETGRERTAIAGLSMGGGQALRIGFGHMDLFSAVGAFSAAAPQDFEKAFGDSLKDANTKLKVIWFGCGREDSLFARSEQLDSLLTARGVKHTFRASSGAHNFTIWRKHLAEFAPLLFR
ncbi:MAG: alpha/beta hydrolase-fold protein [Bryobacteraceae bacterium]